MKRLVALTLTGILLLPNSAIAACFGFTPEEMPDVVAKYICQATAIKAQLVAIQETVQGRVYYLHLHDQEGLLLGTVFQVEDPDGSLGRILYFALPDGTVILDRRANL